MHFKNNVACSLCHNKVVANVPLRLAGLCYPRELQAAAPSLPVLSPAVPAVGVGSPSPGGLTSSPVLPELAPARGWDAAELHGGESRTCSVVRA